MPKQNQLYTVVCQWRRDEKSCAKQHAIAVVLRSDFNAKDAANEACLYLIWDRQGQAQPLFVIEGSPTLTVPDDGIFDAKEYDETITFGSKIVTCRDLS